MGNIKLMVSWIKCGQERIDTGVSTKYFFVLSQRGWTTHILEALVSCRGLEVEGSHSLLYEYYII